MNISKQQTTIFYIYLRRGQTENCIHNAAYGYLIMTYDLVNAPLLVSKHFVSHRYGEKYSTCCAETVPEKQAGLNLNIAHSIKQQYKS